MGILIKAVIFRKHKHILVLQYSVIGYSHFRLLRVKYIRVRVMILVKSIYVMLQFLLDYYF